MALKLRALAISDRHSYTIFTCLSQLQCRGYNPLTSIRPYLKTTPARYHHGVIQNGHSALPLFPPTTSIRPSTSIPTPHLRSYSYAHPANLPPPHPPKTRPPPHPLLHLPPRPHIRAPPLPHPTSRPSRSKSRNPPHNVEQRGD